MRTIVAPSAKFIKCDRTPSIAVNTAMPWAPVRKIEKVISATNNGLDHDLKFSIPKKAIAKPRKTIQPI